MHSIKIQHEMMSFGCVCSEALSTQNYHWVLGRVQHHVDMLTSDKKNARQWERRLGIAIQVSDDHVQPNHTFLCNFRHLFFVLHQMLQTLKELFQNLVTLQSLPGDDAAALFKSLLNNICYVLEFRESVLHLLTSYNENRNSK